MLLIMLGAVAEYLFRLGIFCFEKVAKGSCERRGHHLLRDCLEHRLQIEVEAKSAPRGGSFNQRNLCMTGEADADRNSIRDAKRRVRNYSFLGHGGMVQHWYTS